MLGSLPMMGGEVIGYRIHQHRQTFQQHCDTQAAGHRRRIKERAEQLQQSDTHESFADNELNSDIAAPRLKARGTEAFKKGQMREALMLWRMALDCAQMAQGGALAPHEGETEGAWQRRLHQLLSGLSHASTSVFSAQFTELCVMCTALAVV
jgi:hypothetical protein